MSHKDRAIGPDNVEELLQVELPKIPIEMVVVVKKSDISRQLHVQ